MAKIACFSILLCVLIPGRTVAAPDAGIGTPLHQALWKVYAEDYLRNHPDLFAHLAAAYLGLGSSAPNVQSSPTARVIPNFDSVAAALLRLRIMSPQATIENKQVALGASDDDGGRFVQQRCS